MMTRDEFDELVDCAASLVGSSIREKRKELARRDGGEYTDKKYDYVGIDTSVIPKESYRLRDINTPIVVAEKIATLMQVPEKLYRDFLKDCYNDNADKWYDAVADIEIDILAQKLIDRYADDLYFADDYGEPGYTLGDDKQFVIMADWNDWPNCIFDMLEELGYGCEWSDEWVIDYDQNLAFRSSPSSYGWEPSYFLYEGEIIGIEGNEEMYIELYMNDTNHAVNSMVDPAKYGWEPAEEICHETGWYGVVEDPAEALEHVESQINFDDYLFQICDVGQFAVRWRIWVKNPRKEAA